ncbi:tyrosine-protein kinase receptor torso-like [Hermetia illucens]|uniref:tyrosine-protein kinase receptor torso-like n=1 Tax=Hermetia illucens TaxID=343691 RepID=UPI0018CC1265|nr:tyrosine-protein kinase receptor torso-like [Hermetia illucens]
MNILNIIFCLLVLVVIYDPWIHTYKICTECNVNLRVPSVNQCGSFCDIVSNKTKDSIPSKRSWKLKLICRSDTSLFIGADLDLKFENLDSIVFQIYELYAPETTRPVYYLQDKLVSNMKFDNLSESTSYTVSVAAYNRKAELIGKSKEYWFETLSSKYAPGKPKNLRLQNITIDENNPKAVKARISWEPAGNKNCDFEVVTIMGDYIRSNGGTHGIFYSEVANVEMGTTFHVGIEGKRPNASHLQGKPTWREFTVPSCLEMYPDNLTICAPPEPQGLNFQLSYFYFGSLSIDITWDTPRLLPDYYKLSISVLSPDMKTSTIRYFVSGEKNRFLVNHFSGDGLNVEIQLKAYSKGGFSSAIVGGSLSEIKENALDNYIRFFIMPLGVVIVFVFLILFVACLILKIQKENSELNAKINIHRKKIMAKALRRYLQEVHRNDGLGEILV